MSFTCKNPTRPVHQHNFVLEAKVCWGLVPGAPVAPPVPPVRYATPSQIGYVRDLGGDVDKAARLTVAKCSEYIDELKAKPKESPVVPEVSNYPDPKLGMVEGLLGMIPDGYYAVQRDSGEEITFMRVSRPKKNRFAGATKIQTQHGPRLQDDAVFWPSGRWSFWNYSQGYLVEKLLLLCADHHSAAMRYARELNKCCRCNTELTDPRSRHYGVGPECETKNGYGWVIESVDERNDGMSYETMRARGLIDL